jgi:16S rRNA G1207 methylase RsmC
MKTADQLKQDIIFETTLREHRLCFHTTWGLFSPREIDEGSRLLLRYLAVNDGDVTLDLGCGYGVIGLTIAKMTPNGAVHMVDKDFVALEFAEKNAVVNKVTNCQIYPSNAFSAVGKVKFNTVVSNLPAKVGRELLYIILSDARDHLRPGGQIVVVTISGLREFIKRNFKEVFGNYEKVKQGRNYTVARAFKEK